MTPESQLSRADNINICLQLWTVFSWSQHLLALLKIKPVKTALGNLFLTFKGKMGSTALSVIR